MPKRDDERSRDFLGSWKRLNREPKSADQDFLADFKRLNPDPPSAVRGNEDEAEDPEADE